MRVYLSVECSIQSRLLGLLGSDLLCLQSQDDLVDLGVVKHLEVLPFAQHRHLDILAARLDHLQQCPASQLHAVLRRLVAVVLLKVLLDSLLVAPDGHGLPCGVVARRLCLVKLRLACRAAGPTRLGAETARTPAG
eukprot:scaffold89525_cov63-Phaeocystis_antarctica.AAC.2